MIFSGFVILVVFGLDFLVKYLVSRVLTPGMSVPVLGDHFRITLVHNRGAAFNTFDGMTYLLIGLACFLIVLALGFLFIHRHDADRFLQLDLSLIIGGGLGNLVDRIRFGYVVDLLDIRILPVFNVADMCIVGGCILLCIYVLLWKGEGDDLDD